MNKTSILFPILSLCLLSFTMTGCMSSMPQTSGAANTTTTSGTMDVQDEKQVMTEYKVLEGVMTERRYNSADKIYDYAVVTKDRSRTFTFSSPKKIMYKNDLVQFSAPGGQVDVRSIKLIERKYLQKYWQ